MNQPYTPPDFGKEAFHCPHCGAYAQQTWYTDVFAREACSGGRTLKVAEVTFSRCAHCLDYACWRKGKMIFPRTGTAPLPAADMPEDVKEVYQEARGIVSDSARGAAALLRLALQTLMPHLGEKGKHIDDDIGSLVRKGLRVEIQQALDAVRVIGNNAVHPGEIDLNEEPSTAHILFTLLNVIVQDRITQPKQIREIYGILPASKKEAIERRDGSPS